MYAYYKINKTLQKSSYVINLYIYIYNQPTAVQCRTMNSQAQFTEQITAQSGDQSYQPHSHAVEICITFLQGSSKHYSILCSKKWKI